jgi:hypothetical protein
MNRLYVNTLLLIAGQTLERLSLACKPTPSHLLDTIGARLFTTD